ncbi:MAG: hypothetical protein DI636_07735 [Pelagerythrobacter marensis]|nr:MAG: hypothetical protein DI636_07735 [Pelagerythrobacter marensis]
MRLGFSFEGALNAIANKFTTSRNRADYVEFMREFFCVPCFRFMLKTAGPDALSDIERRTV